MDRVGDADQAPLLEDPWVTSPQLETGLTSEQAALQRRKYGPNLIPEPASLPSWLCCLIPCLKQNHAKKLYDACVPTCCTVKRNGRWVLMDAAGVVVGDLIRVEEGDRAPADLRIIETSLLVVDSIVISGSSQEVAYREKGDELIRGHPDVLHAGSLCIRGRCVGVVTGTGSAVLLARMIKERQWPPQ